METQVFASTPTTTIFARMAAAESVNSGQTGSISSLSTSVNTATNAIFYLKPADGYQSLSTYVYPLNGVGNLGLNVYSSSSWVCITPSSGY